MTSFDADYSNTSGADDECIEFPDTIESMTRAEESEYADMGCLILESVSVDDNNSNFLYKCEIGNGNVAFGQVDIFLSREKITLNRKEKYTNSAGEMNEKATYEPCL